MVRTTRAAAKDQGLDPELLPGEFWLRPQPGTKKDKIKALALWPGSAEVFLVLKFPSRGDAALGHLTTSKHEQSLLAAEKAAADQGGAQLGTRSIDGQSRVGSVDDSGVDVDTPATDTSNNNNNAAISTRIQTGPFSLNQPGEANPEAPEISPITPQSQSIPLPNEYIAKSRQDLATDHSTEYNSAPPTTNDFSPVADAFDEDGIAPTLFTQVPSIGLSHQTRDPVTTTTNTNDSSKNTDLPQPASPTPARFSEATPPRARSATEYQAFASLFQPVPPKSPELDLAALSPQQLEPVLSPPRNQISEAPPRATTPASQPDPDNHQPGPFITLNFPTRKKRSYNQLTAPSSPPPDSQEDSPESEGPGPFITLHLSPKYKIPGYIFIPGEMAPIKDPNDVSNSMKDVIQTMFDIQQNVVGYIPESQDLLVDRIEELTNNLAHLDDITRTDAANEKSVHNVLIPPEVIDYVDDGRNPDIFKRDFVELAQRGNAVMNGKKEAFLTFTQIFAKKLKEGMSGMDKQVDQVMDNLGIEHLKDGEELGKGGAMQNGEQSSKA